jgi:plasmid stabilization system protein ParE
VKVIVREAAARDLEDILDWVSNEYDLSMLVEYATLFRAAC